VVDGDSVDSGDFVGDFLGESAELIPCGLVLVSILLLLVLLLLLLLVFVETEMGLVVLAVLVLTVGKSRFGVVVVTHNTLVECRLLLFIIVIESGTSCLQFKRVWFLIERFSTEF